MGKRGITWGLLLTLSSLSVVLAQTSISNLVNNGGSTPGVPVVNGGGGGSGLSTPGLITGKPISEESTMWPEQAC